MLSNMILHGTRLPGSRALPLLAGFLMLDLFGCSAGGGRILDSDIPRMPGMEQRLGFDIQRSRGELVGGVFVFIGGLEDMQEGMAALVSRFREAGWSLERSDTGYPRSSATFARGTRRVAVVIDADQLQPSMSRAQYVVSRDSDPSAPVGREEAETSG